MLTYRLIDSSNKIQPFILVFSCFLRKHHHVLTICQINSIDSFAREVFWHQLKPPRTRNHQVVGDTNGIPITFQQETPVFFHGQMSWMVPWNPMKSNEFSSNSMKPHEPWQNPPYFGPPKSHCVQVGRAAPSSAWATPLGKPTNWRRRRRTPTMLKFGYGRWPI